MEREPSTISCGQAAMGSRELRSWQGTKDCVCELLGVHVGLFDSLINQTLSCRKSTNVGFICKCKVLYLILHQATFHKLALIFSSYAHQKGSCVLQDRKSQESNHQGNLCFLSLARSTFKCTVVTGQWNQQREKSLCLRGPHHCTGLFQHYYTE